MKFQFLFNHGAAYFGCMFVEGLGIGMAIGVEIRYVVGAHDGHVHVREPLNTNENHVILASGAFCAEVAALP